MFTVYMKDDFGVQDVHKLEVVTVVVAFSFPIAQGDVSTGADWILWNGLWMDIFVRCHFQKGMSLWAREIWREYRKAAFYLFNVNF